MYNLTHLSITNYKLLKKASLTFDSGLTVVSGTTGAGKSMFIGALQLLTGGKASKSLFELTDQKIILAAEFSGVDDSINSLLEEHSIARDEGLIIRREIKPSGQNRCLVNDTPVTVAFLANLGSRMIDFHGQHEDQAVLKPAIQLETVDRFANHHDLIDAYKNAYASLHEAHAELQELRTAEREREDRLHLLQFKLGEIEAINPEPHELEELESKVQRLKNGSHIQEHLQKALFVLNEGDSSIQSNLNSLISHLDTLHQLDPSFEALLNQGSEALNLLTDLSYSMSAEQGESTFDDDDFNTMQERLFSLKSLEKKFARSYDEVITYQRELEDELQTMQNIDAALEVLSARIKTDEKTLHKQGKALSVSRQKAARLLEQRMATELKELALPDAIFKVEITPKPTKGSELATVKGISLGLDTLIFTAQLNKGIAFAPIKDIASGGETARIMLALKKVIAHRDAIGTLIFDEIDSDTGGRLGAVIGEKMRQIANSHQVIAITHLPQVAAYGAHHLKVEKVGDKGSTTTGIRHLNPDERQEEIAQMMTGDKVSELARQHAKTLLSETGVLSCHAKSSLVSAS